MDDPFVLVLAGPPGAGKSTVARLVAARFEPSACIESDWFFTTVVNGFIPPWELASADQNRVLLQAAAGAAARFAAGGYATVLEGVLGPWHLDALRAELAPASVPVSYVVLRPTLAAVLERATGRAGETPRIEGNPPLTDPEPLRFLWQQFADLGPHERHVLDTTHLDAIATADAVVAALAAGSHRLAPLTADDAEAPDGP